MLVFSMLHESRLWLWYKFTLTTLFMVLFTCIFSVFFIRADYHFEISSHLSHLFFCSYNPYVIRAPNIFLLIWADYHFEINLHSPHYARLFFMYAFSMLHQSRMSLWNKFTLTTFFTALFTCMVSVSFMRADYHFDINSH